MRKAFIASLIKLAQKDERVMLLTGDLGYTVLEPFKNKFRKRFINMGVAEQNMIGVATGLAEAGYIPYVYSITTFACLRPFEVIRNGPILHKLPVRIVGVGGGFEYGNAGITHYGLEDIGVMRTQPGITVIAPVDAEQISEVMQKTWNLTGPIYLRIGKDENRLVPQQRGKFSLGRVNMIRPGKDVLIYTLGSITNQALMTANILQRHGVSCAVAAICSINPVPVADLKRQLSKFNLALTLEAHYNNGGIGSLVAEIIAEQNLKCKLIRCGVKHEPDGISGNETFMLKKHKLNSNAVSNKILSILNK